MHSVTLVLSVNSSLISGLIEDKTGMRPKGVSMKRRRGKFDHYAEYLDRRTDLKTLMREALVATECARVKVIEAVNAIYAEENTPADHLFRDHLDEALDAINRTHFSIISIASQNRIASTPSS
jgi:hypothetical protein